MRGIEVDRVLAQIAQQHFGLIHDEQARSAGISPHQIRRRVAGGSLENIHPRVRRMRGGAQTWEQRQMAACMWAGTGWFASGLAAGALWSLDGVESRRVEISGSGRVNRPPAGVTVHERCVFLPGDTTRLRAIPVTAPARTVIDLAGVLDPLQLERAFECAVRRGLVTPEYLMRRMRRLGTKGRKRITELVEILVRRGHAPPSDSDFEVLLAQVLRAGGLPPPEMQREIYDAEGFVARVDFLYPLVRLILEADSYKHHGGRADWENDAAKRARLVALGFRILPVTWRMINDDPATVQKRVRDALRTNTP